MQTSAEKQAILFGSHRGALRYLLVKDAHFAHEICTRSKLEVNELLTTDRPVDPQVVDCLWQRIEFFARKEHSLWLDAGRLFQLRDLGELAWLIYYAENFHAAISALQKFVLKGEVEIETVGDKTLVSLSANQSMSGLMVQYFVAGFLVSMTGLGIPQNLIKKIFLPEWVAPADEFECKQWIEQARKEFRVPISFTGKKIVFKLESKILSVKLRTADPAIHAFFKNRLDKSELPEESRKDTENDSKLVAQLKKSIKAGLNSSRLDAKNIAESVGVSVRTLERTLARQNLTLRSLKQQIQKETATELLQIGFRAKEVAAQVGFSDVAAFSRAYCGWTGRPPSQIRKQL